MQLSVLLCTWVALLIEQIRGDNIMLHKCMGQTQDLGLHEFYEEARHSGGDYCSDQNFTRGWNVSRQNNACKPRNVLVKLNTGKDNKIYSPSHVEVTRCVGHCDGSSKPCNPLREREKLVQVQEIDVTTKRFVCGNVVIMEHYQCGCDCPSHVRRQCNQLQEFDPETCQCVCKESLSSWRDHCTRMDWDWDEEDCHCHCEDEPEPCLGGHWIPWACRCAYEQ